MNQIWERLKKGPLGDLCGALLLLVLLLIGTALILAAANYGTVSDRCHYQLKEIPCFLRTYKELAGSLIGAAGTIMAGWLAWRGVQIQLREQRLREEPVFELNDAFPSDAGSHWYRVGAMARNQAPASIVLRYVQIRRPAGAKLVRFDQPHDVEWMTSATSRVAIEGMIPPRGATAIERRGSPIATAVPVQVPIDAISMEFQMYLPGAGPAEIEAVFTRTDVGPSEIRRVVRVVLPM